MNKFKKGDSCYFISASKSFMLNKKILKAGPNSHDITIEKMVICRVNPGKIIDLNGIVFDYQTVGGSNWKEENLLNFEELLTLIQKLK